MNFLAHIYLSYNNPEIQIGNFIADSVRSKQLENYTPEIKKGVLLHWEIDRYTDQHDVVKESKKLLYPKYGKYAAVLVDIFYDHYLAKNWLDYNTRPLDQEVQEFYSLLDRRKEELPENIQKMLPFMKRENWLYNYQFIEGMDNVLKGMGRRATFNSKMEEGVQELQLFYTDFEQHFLDFFPDLEKRVKIFLKA